MTRPRQLRSSVRAAICATLCVGAAAGCGGGNGDNPFVSDSNPTTPVTITTASASGGTGTDTDVGSGTAETESSATTNQVTSTTAASGSTTVVTTDTDTNGSTTDGTTTGNLVVPCTGVDVLFVVDNSVGMAEEQTRLQSTAFAFMQSLVGMVTVTEGIHVGVVTTDEAELVVPLDMLMVPTTYASGFNYMVWDPVLNPMLQTELNAAVLVGEAGSVDERPMDTLIEAVAGPTASAFNANFIREDALLVVVLVSDEEDDVEEITDYGSAGDPGDWVTAVTAIKGGFRRDVVVLSLVPSASTCAGDMDAPRLTEFTTTFPRGAVHDVCDLDYSAFLLGEVQSIVQACSLFFPP